MPKENKRILVHLGAGVGNVIQATPMISCLSRAGCAVDLCIQADYAGTVDLFKGWKAVRRVSSEGSDFTPNGYDYYIIGICMPEEPIRFRDAERAVTLRLNYSYRDIPVISEADLYLNAGRAIEPGIEVSYDTYCGKSDRSFPEISGSTCVLGPGGKFGFAIKKWDRYDLLAERFRDTAVVGIGRDLDISNSRTFPKLLTAIAQGSLNHKTIAWRILKIFSTRTARRMRFGNEVKMYLDRLSLADTAALIDQAGFFIGNDCGLAHIAIARGKPTFVIVGPTSTRKNFAHFKNVYPISLDCECRPCQEKTPDSIMRSSTARHFCPHGIRCLRGITVDRVYDHAKTILSKNYGIHI